MKRWPGAALALVASTLVSVSISTPAQTPTVSPSPAVAGQPIQPGSSTTNATVADVVTHTQGRTLTLRFKDGKKR